MISLSLISSVEAPRHHYRYSFSMSILIWETLVPVLRQKSILIFLLLLFVTPSETYANDPPPCLCGCFVSWGMEVLRAFGGCAGWDVGIPLKGAWRGRQCETQIGTVCSSPGSYFKVAIARVYEKMDQINATVSHALEDGRAVLVHAPRSQPM